MAKLSYVRKVESSMKSRYLPHLHRPVEAPGGNAFPIRRPRDRPHNIGMPTIGVAISAIDCIPYLYCPILAPGGNAFPIRRPRDCVHLISMTLIEIVISAIGLIPYIHGMIPCTES